MAGKKNQGKNLASEVEKLFSERRERQREDPEEIIRSRLSEYRQQQIKDAYRAALGQYRGDLNVATVLGFLSAENLCSRILMPLRGYIGKGEKDAGNGSSENSMLRGLAGLESAADDQMVRHLTQYAVEKGIDPENVVSNKRAMRQAIEKTYGSVEKYKESIFSNIVMLNSTVDKLKNLDSKVSGTVDISAGDAEDMAAALRLLGSKIPEIKPYLVAGKSVLAGIGKYRDEIVEFGELFLKNYGLARAKEVEKY